jgi:hypothetical protein
VQVRKADVERLAQEARVPISQPSRAAPGAANTRASVASPEQPPQSASLAETLAPKATRKVKRVATVLRKEWSEGRPDKSVDEMLNFVLTKIRPVSKTTVERAIRWLHAQGWRQPRLD